MKVNIQKQIGILKIDEENCVELLDIDRNLGLFKYNLIYSADALSALRKNAAIVEIKASLQPIVSIGKNKINANKEVLDQILSQNANNKEASRASEANFFLTLNSDITSKIPNNKANQISAFKNGQIDQNFFLSTRKVFKTEEVRDENLKNSIEPNYQHTLHTGDGLPTNDVQVLSERLIFTDFIDPATAGERTNFIVSTKTSYSGLLQKPLNNTNQSVSQLVQSLIGQTSNSKAKDDEISVLTIEQTNFLDIEETIKIPIGILGDEFYLLFSLKDREGLEIERKVVYVNHAKLYRNYISSMKPPIVNGTSTNYGQISLEIYQNDKNAQGVFLYKRELSRNLTSSNSSYCFIKKIPLKIEDGKYSFLETSSNYNPTIYRVIPYNELDIKGSEFASVVISSRNFPTIIRDLENKKNTFCSLFATVENTSIRVEVLDFPSEATGLMLFKRDLSGFQTQKNIIGKYVDLRSQTKGIPLVFRDILVERDHIYEYSVKLFFKTGDEIFSQNKAIFQYIPIVSNIVDTFASPPSVTTGKDINVEFDIVATIQDTNIDSLRNAMESQGILGFFQDDIVENRERLQQLMAFKIVRTNLTTGEVEDFGTITKTSFDDRKFGSISAAKPLKSGNEYRYAIYTFLRSAETMLETFERSVEYSTNPSRNYSFKPSKWHHPVTLNTGDLVSENTLIANYARTGFTLGILSSISYVDVSLLGVNPFLFDPLAVKLNKKQILIQWTVQGEVSKIDHFIVILEILGMKTIVGKVHNISETNNFTYIDSLDNNEQGALRYRIVPVFTDYSRGTEIKTNRVLI